VYRTNGSGFRFVVPKTINPRNRTRDLWLRLQKQKLEAGSADVQEIDRQMIDLEIYRRRQNRQPSQPSAAQVAQAEAETSSEDEMPDVPPLKRLRTKLRF